MLTSLLRDITLWATLTFAWESLLKPLRTRRQVARVLVTEVLQNYRFVITFPLRTKLGGKVPAGFGLHTKGFHVCEGSIGALPIAVLTSVLRLYDRYDSVHRHRDYILGQWGKEIDEAARDFRSATPSKPRPGPKRSTESVSAATPAADAPQNDLWQNIEDLRRDVDSIKECSLKVAEELHRIADPLWWPGSWFNADRRLRARELAEHQRACEEKKGELMEAMSRLEHRELGVEAGAEEW